MARELEINIDGIPDRGVAGPAGGYMVVTGLRAGHAPAVASALEMFVKSERARFPDGTSGVGFAAEEFLAALNKARGF